MGWTDGGRSRGRRLLRPAIGVAVLVAVSAAGWIAFTGPGVARANGTVTTAPGRSAESVQPWFTGLVANLDSLLAAHPYVDTTRVQSDRISSVEGASVHLVQTRVTVPPHYHADHDETVVVLRGRGRFLVGDREGKERRTVSFAPLSIFVIDRGSVHTAEVVGPETVVVLSIFAPPFDPKDRIPVPEWLPKSKP